MKHKLGDKITIEVWRVRKATRRAVMAVAPAPHYGAIRRIEDDENIGTAELMLLDCSMKWQDFGDDSSLPDNDDPLPPGVMCYVQRDDLYAPYWDAFYLDHISSIYRGCFNRDSVKLPPFSGTEYRRIDRAMPLPFRVSDTLNLTVKLSVLTFSFT